MRNFLGFLNILSWPLWVKLSAGFLAAILIPVLLVLVVGQSGLNDLNTERMRLYIEENGIRQQTAIASALTEVATRLDTFTASATTRQQLLLELRSAESIRDNRLISFQFQNRLFGDRLIERVRLLNRTGLVVAQTTANEVLESGMSNAESLAYLRAQEAFENQRILSATVLPDGTIEITRVVVEGGDALGYLIATLDETNAVFAPLALSGNTFGVYSYLVNSAENPVLITLPQDRPAASEALVNSPAVARALAGSSQTAAYRTGATREQSVIGFYAPIPDPTNPETPLLVLVTEASAVQPLGEALAHFGGSRAFVLLVGSGLVLLTLVLLFNQLITPPVTQLRRAMQAITRGDFSAPVTVARHDDEIGLLTGTFVDMRDQVRTLIDDLEKRIAARTRDINATQEVSRFAATQRNLQTLLDEVVNLIVKHFPNIYHAQIFLLDDDSHYAVLRASTGEVGRTLLQRGHRLAVGSVSVIGQVTQQGQVVVARDTASSQVHRRNEFLPDTRAELAIPLRISERVIGALDVQSKQRNAFAHDEINVLQTMADQIAVAIENAILYQESVRRLAEIERINREATRATWQEYIYSLRRRSLTSAAGIPTGTDMSDLRQQAVREGRIAIGQVTANNTVPVAVPIQLSGQTLGAVEWELPAEHLDDNRLILAQELANRLAISLDNARLFEESQRAAERERLVNAIAAKLTPQTEVSEILQTAVREVGQALRAPQVSIRLHPTNGHSETNGNHNPK